MGLLPILLVLGHSACGWVKNAAVGPNVSRTFKAFLSTSSDVQWCPRTHPNQARDSHTHSAKQTGGRSPDKAKAHVARMRKGVHACCGPDILHQILGPVSQAQQGYVPLLAGHPLPHKTQCVDTPASAGSCSAQPLHTQPHMPEQPSSGSHKHTVTILLLIARGPKSKE